MDNDSIFIPCQILTVFIVFFSYTITHIPLIKKKKLFALITIELSFWLLFGRGFGGGNTLGVLMIDSLYTWPYSIFGYFVIFTVFCKLTSFQGTYDFFPGMHLIPTQRGCE